MNRSITLALCAVLVPAIASADPDRPVIVVTPNVQTVPPATAYVGNDGTVVYDRWNMPRFVSGAMTFGVSYGAAAIASGVSDHPGADQLAIPLVGPWLALNDWGNCPVTNPNCAQDTGDKVLLVVDGIFQAAGVITMIDALVEPSHHVTVIQTAQRGIHFAPTGTGFKVFGAF